LSQFGGINSRRSGVVEQMEEGRVRALVIELGEENTSLQGYWTVDAYIRQ